MDDDRGMAKEVEVVQNLGRKDMLSCMREGISVCAVVVVLKVLVGVVVLMVVVCLGAYFWSVQGCFYYGDRWDLRVG